MNESPQPRTVDLPATPDKRLLTRQPGEITQDDSQLLGQPVRCFPPEILPRTFGAYELLEKLGQGGGGVVYKARQPALNRIVALKLLRADLLAEDQSEDKRRHLLQRWQRETEAAARLHHVHLLTVFEVGCHEERPYYTMPYIEGCSLASVLHDGPLPERAAALLLETIARAVHAAHTAGILHRDLKPGNILLDPRRQPYVADFGLAKFITERGDLTQNGIVGTPAYMAPEQIRGELVTTASDQFSLGVILYETLTGKRPFAGASIPEISRHVCEQPPPAPRQLQPGLARDLETICLKCLHKEPHHRYQSCAGLADDLARWQRGEPIRARPFRVPERLWLWCKRKPLLAMLSAALVLALLGGTAASLWQWQRAEGEKQFAEQQRDLSNETVQQVLKWVNQHCREVADSRWLDAPGMRPQRLHLIQQARRLCEKLQVRRQDQPAIRAEIAQAWGLIGRLTQEVDPGEHALEALHEARKLYEPLALEQPDHYGYRFGLAQSYADLSRAYRYTADREKGRSYFQRALVLWEQLRREGHEEAELRYEHGKILGASFWLLFQEEEARRNRDEAVRLLEKVVAEQPQQLAWLTTLCHCYSTQWEDEIEQGKFEQALATCAKYRQRLSRLPVADQQRVSMQQLLGMGENGTALVWLRRHQHRNDPSNLEHADKCLQAALDIRRRLAQENPDAPALFVEWAVTTLNQGSLCAARKQPREAIKKFDESRQLFEKWAEKNPLNRTHQNTLAGCYLKLGREQRKCGDYDIAFKWLCKSKDTYDNPSKQRLQQLADEFARCLPKLQPAEQQQCRELLAWCAQEKVSPTP